MLKFCLVKHTGQINDVNVCKMKVYCSRKIGIKDDFLKLKIILAIMLILTIKGFMTLIYSLFPAEPRGRYRRYDVDDRGVQEEGCPIERAGKRFSVPITTLKDHVKDRVSIDTVRSGPSTAITQEDEDVLHRHLKVTAEVGFGYLRQETLNLASDLAFHLGIRDRKHPLSFDWFYSFMSQWPDLKITKPRSIEAAIAKSATE